MTPREIAHYRILGELGRGGMGEVYRALDTKLNREVAIKVIPVQFVEDSARMARFHREAQVLAALNHPNIAAIYGLEDRALVMELVQGQTLEEIVTKGALKVEEAVRIGNQIVDALSAAHQKGITHRDIKPSNIKVTSDGRIKVLDFGLAKAALGHGESDEERDSTVTALTQAGLFLGTPAYVSPEQARGQEVDGRTDIWAFGCVLFELLTGKRPFTGNNTLQLVAAVLTADPDWSRLPNDTPATVRELLRRCLEKDPQRRLDNIALARIEIDAAVRIAADTKSPPAARGVGSLAVLPFSNVSGDPHMEYLSDGLTESIIGRLAQSSQLRVMSRSVVFQYKGRSQEVQAIGKTLGIEVVLSGTVLRHGDTLQVRAEAIDVEHGWQVWSGQFRRKLDDIFELEDAISEEIAEKLKVTLAPEAKRSWTKRYTENVGAYHLYLKGRYYCGKRTEDGLFKGIQFFRQAVELDATYALAHAGVAEAYVPLGFYCHLAPGDACPKAKSAALAALDLDPDLPEALTALSSILAFYDWNPGGAETELRRALSLKPGYSRAHQVLSETLAVVGRQAEAAAEMKLALDLDPLALHLNAAVTMMSYFTREFDLAIEYGERTIEMDPGFFPGYFYTGLAYQLKGQYQEALDNIEKARTISNNSTLMTCALGGVYAAWGKQEEAHKILQELTNTSASKYVPQTPVAAIHVALGLTDRALACLEKATLEHCTWLLRALSVDPRFDRIRKEPRFQALVRHVRLPAS